MIPCQQLLTNEFLSGLQLNFSIRDVVNSCFISTRIKEVPYEPQLDVGIYFNIVDLCGILPYKKMYPYKCGIKINFDILTTQKDQ